MNSAGNRNNLGSGASKNAYFEVVAAFQVYALIGHSESQTFVGSSRMLGRVYARLLLEPGDQVHDTFGGVFVVTKDGEAHEARYVLPTWHPFEGKYHLDEVERWPLECLREIEEDKARSPKLSYRRDMPMMPQGVRVGRGIDSVLEHAQCSHPQRPRRRA